ncbi:MAG: hypothetical protein IPP22_14635 [Nitrosomonas sp.]|nr:hypothetical protein [Nitrosomonas sp.]
MDEQKGKYQADATRYYNVFTGCREICASGPALHHRSGKHPHSNLATRLYFERTNVAAKEYAGVYCLRTNMLDWDAGKLWRTYIMLTDLEAVFRSLENRN